VLNRASMVIDAAIEAKALRLPAPPSPPRTSSTAVWSAPSDRAAACEELLDRLPQSEGRAAEHRPIPKFAPARGSGGCSAAKGPDLSQVSHTPILIPLGFACGARQTYTLEVLATVPDGVSICGRGWPWYQELPNGGFPPHSA
jgi:hypothetical protein